jgi:acetyl-CoA synthetase
VTPLQVRQAFVDNALVSGTSRALWEPTAHTALAIMRNARGRPAPCKRVRRIDFAELPKTISGKIRRVDLREVEDARHSGPTAPVTARRPGEYWEQDFPGLKG